MSTIFFTTQRNALKRDDSSGSANLAPPTTSAYSGAIYTTSKVVAHNLGYVPIFRIYYEPFGDGVVWPPLASRSEGHASNPLNSAVLGPGIIAWADSSNLNIRLFYDTNGLTNNYPVYWVIYRDYAL